MAFMESGKIFACFYAFGLHRHYKKQMFFSRFPCKFKKLFQSLFELATHTQRFFYKDSVKPRQCKMWYIFNPKQLSLWGAIL